MTMTCFGVELEILIKMHADMHFYLPHIYDQPVLAFCENDLPSKVKSDK